MRPWLGLVLAAAAAGAQTPLDLLGGPVPDAALQDYVERVADRAAEAMGADPADFVATVADDPRINAIVLQDGQILVTRGMVALASDEAALGAVLAHEIAHLVAGHPAQREAAGDDIARAAIWGALRGALDDSARGAIRGAVTEGLTLAASFSQAQEYEADALAHVAMAKTGWDTAALADILGAMEAAQTLRAEAVGRGPIPPEIRYFATHPATPDRIEALPDGPDGARGAEVHAAAIDGLVWGDSPAQGLIRDGGFYHGELGFAFEAPPGWPLANSPARVVANGPGPARLTLDGAGSVELERYVRRTWLPALFDDGAMVSVQPETADLNGLEAVRLEVTLPPARGEPRVGILAAIALNDRVYRLIGIGTIEDAPALRAAIDSFRPLAPEDAPAPWRIHVREVQVGDSVASLSAAMPFGAQNERWFRALNALPPGAEPRAGDVVKLVM